MWVLIGIAALAFCGPIAPVEAEDRALPGRARLEADVFRLASPEFEGRSGDGARAAGDFLIDRLRGLGLEPAFDGRFDQEFAAGDLRGRNIAALLPGSDPDRSEVVILSAHYDHLGIRGGRLFPGADDNATAVAMVLEVARRLAGQAEPPTRGILFVFFDLEERGLLGSQHFVREPPLPRDRIGLFMTADMLGRSLAGVGGDSLFIMGTEHAPGLRPWIFEAAEGLPLSVGVVGADLLAIDRSDYGPFRQRSIPFLFFSTGESPAYHTPDDLPETIDYGKLSAATALIERVVRRACSADELPGWTPDREPWIEEAVAIREVLAMLLEHEEELEIPALQKSMMSGMVERIGGWVEEGSLTPPQRMSMLRVAQVVLFTVL
ncbi:M28 family metallopeptidase [Tautonia plasticadhaerens]|uniref:Aminopeptidase YwaD n=1 Tax=Tautonia plasticadhaerens TaxID=2527974 RepID=A0A518GYI6_9BACT|nr:M28 family peptidase [Tautonia plasticadhaerens]QDV33660.1 Aminopeptidase YwaD precursor [Tautonia plasticadhaerens]